MIETKFVLNEGFVRLDAAVADDLSVVNAARVSLGRHVEMMKHADDQLVGFLMRNKHGTPFEHTMFRWHVMAPIFVTREWMRHRIGSFNEFSMRYTRAPEHGYVPTPEAVRGQVGKPGEYSYEALDEATAKYIIEEILKGNKEQYARYRRLLDHGAARELARVVLPVSWYTEFYWTVNARSLMNFLELRNAPTALHEIRRYAETIEPIFAELMPVTHAAFTANGRVAP